MHWEEVATFDPAKPPDAQKIQAWVDEIVVSCMREFEAEPFDRA